MDSLGLTADVALAMKSNVAVINALNLEIDRLESRLLEGVKLRPEYARLKSIPGSQYRENGFGLSSKAESKARKTRLQQAGE